MAVAAADVYTAQGTAQVVGFRLAGEEFAVPILSIREINQRPEITAVPHSPPHVRGITNLRGSVIPVVELATRFGMPIPDDRKDERMIVLEVAGRPVGFLVDAVTQVRRIEREQISPPPAVSNDGHAAFIAGIAKLDDRLVILLDPALLVDAEDLPDTGAMA